MAFGLAAVVGCSFFFGQKALSQPQPIAESSKLKSACATLLETFVEGFSLSFWDRRLATGLQLVARVIFLAFVIFLDIFISLNYGALISELVRLFG